MNPYLVNLRALEASLVSKLSDSDWAQCRASLNAELLEIRDGIAKVLNIRKGAKTQ